MDKYFRGDDMEISFHCLMDGWRNMRMRHCVFLSFEFHCIIIIMPDRFGNLELRPHPLCDEISSFLTSIDNSLNFIYGQALAFV